MDDDLRNRYRRDYANEVLRTRPPARPAPSHQPLPPPAEPQPHHLPPKNRAPRRRRRLFLAILLLLLIAGAGGGGYWYLSHKLSSPVPVSIRAAAGFPIPYPTQLPAGYRLDSSSFNASGGVVLYSAVSQAGDKIAFTVQRRPAAFDFNSFYTKGLSNSTSFNTAIGQAAIGTSNGKLLGSLVTGQSWLLVSSTSKSVQSDDLKLILDGLKQASR